MRKLLLFVFIFLSYWVWGQGNMITINSTVPSQLTVCGQAKNFTITIYNPSPFTLKNDTLFVSLPPGINYQLGSIAGAIESNLSVLNQPVFLLDSIPTLTTVHISFKAAVTCDVLPFLAGGGIVENTNRINYLANGTNNFDTQTTSSYIVRQPNLSISAVTNQSYSGSIGDNFTRCITVTNGGFGELSQFTFTDVHGSGIQMSAITPGFWLNSGTTESITFSGAQFSTVGDHDTLFENGESITFCENINIINCISVASTFEAYWGCNAQHCQSSIANGNVVFPNLIPNLVITPIAAMNTCIGTGNASLQQLKVVNTGLGKAIDLQLDLFQTGGAGSGYQASLGSYLDTASFTVQTGLNGTPTHITFTGAYATATLACMTSPKGRVTFTVPLINPGDTVYIKFNTYSCCYNDCTNYGSYDINGWRYKGTYQNICQSTYIIPETWGRVYSRLRTGLANNGSPSTMINGQSGTFNFLFTYYENTFPVGPGAYWKFEFTLPPCLTYTGGLQILRSNGINTWNPASVTTSGNTVTAIFNGAPPWNLQQAQVMLNVIVDCSQCGGSYSGAVTVKASYIPNNTCVCEIVPSCQTTAISIICPSPCPEGMVFNNFMMPRTSYGLPDNEAGGGNGLPDSIGSLDFSKIKTDRAMFGDTITATFNGTVKTSLAYPSWQYCFATSSIANGNRLTFLDAALYIYRGGALIATCNTFTPTITNSGSTRTFKYNLSVASVGVCLSGFTYQNNDSVLFKPRYKVTSNIGNATPINCYSTNEYYLSDIANPTLAANKFQCNNFNGNATIIGYYFHSHGPDSYVVKSCDNITISQNYYLSIGPCCSNYGGGNLFPYEYRNWSHIKTLTARLPHGYDFISAQFNQVRTAGTLVTSTSSWIPLMPVNSNSDTLQFPVEQYFKGYGGTQLTLSDDGYHGTLQVVVRPSCRVTPVIQQPIFYDWAFGPTTYLTGTGSAATTVTLNNDTIAYDAPNLFLQSTLPSINAPDMLASWDISISNTSNTSNALNTWLSGPAFSGVTITRVFDLDNNVIINPVGSIYQIGAVNATAVRHFRITASFTSCLKDSIIVYSGWNCNAGYPTSVNTYPCTPKSIKLSLTPLMPALVANITAPSGTIQLCDTASYLIEGVNVQLGTSYNNLLTAILPSGVDIVTGSSLFSYPITDPYVTIPDPTFMGGTTWQWDISVIDSLIGADGFKGIIQLALNKFNLTFKVITNCGYTSGSTIAFSLKGEAACGQPTGQEVALSSQLGITGATTPYTTAVSLATTYISPCAANSSLLVSVKNLGPLSFGSLDTVMVQLPGGVSFVNGTFAGIHNQPINGIPVQYTLNGSQYLKWKLPSGVASGDSSVFSFDYKGDPLLLDCDIKYFNAKSTAATSVVCSSDGTNCGINITTGDTTLAVFTYKAYLALSNGQTLSVPNPPNGETVTIGFDITNTGQAILSGASSIVQFYFDANGNGVYDGTDVFLTQDTLLVSNNSTVHYSKTFDVNSGQACSIIATVRDAVNPCVCNPSHLTLSLGLITLGNDTTICSGQTMAMGGAPVNGYSYSWSPTTGLSSASISNPVFTSSNLTNAPVATKYILTTNRMGCVTKDTIQITVNPLPHSNAGTDTTVCPTVAVHNMGTSSTAGYAYSWSPALGLSNVLIANPTVSLLTPGTTTYTVTTTALGCVTKDSAVIKINPLPTATILGTTVVCKNDASPNITFTGANGTTPYTFTYTINGGSDLTAVTMSGNSITVAVPTNVVDTLMYNLISVQDASSTACSQLQSDSVTVIVNPLPTATISGTAEVCNNAVNPSIVFVGANGTVPYTFTYTISGGLAQTVISTGDTAVVMAPTNVVGAYTYSLVSVADASVSACSQTQTGTAIINVNPVPTATISGSASVCKEATAPFVTFNALGGTAPYAFTYNINGDTVQTIHTLGGDSSVTILAPTDSVGTFVYNLLSVQDSSVAACIQTQVGAVTITINPLPTAAIYGDTTVCKNATSPVVTFVGANGTPPYTFTYALNGSVQPTITTSGGDSTSVSVATTTVGAFAYTLLSVSDASSTTCSQLQADTAIVIVNPLPTATITGTATICENDSAPTIFFIGASGTAPYTFTYSVNSGPNQTITSNVDTAMLVFPTSIPGTYTFSLLSVTDGSIAACEQQQNGSATILVHPILQAFIAGSTSACKDEQGVLITFTGINGVAPYTFTYTLNGLTQPTVTTSNGNSVTVVVPTNNLDTLVYQLVDMQESNANNCLQIMEDSAIVTVSPLPVVDFSSQDVCLHQAVNFIDASTVDSGAVTSWLWNFGENNSLSLSQNPSYTYGSANTFNVELKATSDKGCVNSVVKPVVVHPLPNPNFSAANVCQGDTMHFFNLTTIPVQDTLSAWTWNFGDNTNVSNGKDPEHLYATFGSYTVSLAVESTFGCVDSILKVVVVNPKPIVNFMAFDTIGCEPLCVSFQDSSSIYPGANIHWLWDVGDGTTSSNGSVFEHCYTNDSVSVPLSNSVTLTVTSDSGCVTTLTKTNLVTVYPLPIAAFGASPFETSIMDPVISINDSSIGANFWNWNFGDNFMDTISNPQPHQYADTGTYTITLITTTQYGCLDTAYQTVLVRPDFSFYVPNAFTPDGDGLNDTFNGKGIYIREYEMMIFDRWGNLVYQTVDFNHPWDGRANGGKDLAQRDVYVYVIKLIDIFSNEHRYKGTVTLVR